MYRTHVAVGVPTSLIRTNHDANITHKSSSRTAMTNGLSHPNGTETQQRRARCGSQNEEVGLRAYMSHGPQTCFLREGRAKTQQHPPPYRT